MQTHIPFLTYDLLMEIFESKKSEGYVTWPNEEQSVFISIEDARVLIQYDEQTKRPDIFEMIIARDIAGFVKMICLAWEYDFKLEDQFLYSDAA